MTGSILSLNDETKEEEHFSLFRDSGGNSGGGARLDRPAILAIGSEGSGIPWEVLSYCGKSNFIGCIL